MKNLILSYIQRRLPFSPIDIFINSSPNGSLFQYQQLAKDLDSLYPLFNFYEKSTIAASTSFQNNSTNINLFLYHPYEFSPTSYSPPSLQIHDTAQIDLSSKRSDTEKNFSLNTPSKSKKRKLNIDSLTPEQLSKVKTYFLSKSQDIEERESQLDIEHFQFSFPKIQPEPIEPTLEPISDETKPTIEPSPIKETIPTDTTEKPAPTCIKLTNLSDGSSSIPISTLTTLNLTNSKFNLHFESKQISFSKHPSGVFQTSSKPLKISKSLLSLTNLSHPIYAHFTDSSITINNTECSN